MTGILELSIFGYILRLCSSVLENRRYFIYDTFLMISKNPALGLVGFAF